MFDLDDARPEAGEEERRERSGEGECEIEDRQAGERTAFSLNRSLREHGCAESTGAARSRPRLYLKNCETSGVFPSARRPAGAEPQQASQATAKRRLRGTTVELRRGLPDASMPVLKRPRTAVAESAPRHSSGHSIDPSPTAIIEAQLSPGGEPVLGLYLHVAYHRVMASFGRRVGHGQVTPAIIGALAMLAECPGISQATLARRIGLERATIGTTVARAIAAGLVVRRDAHGDARSYALSLSPRGEKILRELRQRIAEHEKAAGAHLTASERRTLRSLLRKLVYGQ